MPVKPSRYRSQIKIYYDILKVIWREGGCARPTKILYGANLSYDRLQKYIAQLKEKGFIVEYKDEEEKVVWYELTEKAYGFLEQFKRIQRFMDAFGFSI
jgi:predicted transcriptional regulator